MQESTYDNFLRNREDRNHRRRTKRHDLFHLIYSNRARAKLSHILMSGMMMSNIVGRSYTLRLCSLHRRDINAVERLQQCKLDNCTKKNDFGLLPLSDQRYHHCLPRRTVPSFHHKHCYLQILYQSRRII